MFKKKKIGKKIDLNILSSITKKDFLKSKFKISILTLTIGILSILFVLALGSRSLNEISNIKFLFDISWFLDELSTKAKIKSDNKKTNVLIIGRGGKESDTPDLTDSIIVASLNYEKKTISMLSIPRDLYVNYPDGYGGRINEAYSRGKKRTGKEIDGINLLKEIVQKIIGENIHYYANLDFAGFKEMIDIIGGIDINIPEAIVDYAYPGPNGSYQVFRISAGPQTLDGDTALKYARSRHTTSDFDRSLRQQLIIKAIKEKVFSLGILANPQKLKSMLLIARKHITTDLNNSQIISLAMYIRDLPEENIISSNLNDSCFYGSAACKKGGFLIVPPREQFGGASVLLREGGLRGSSSDYSSIQKYANLLFNYPGIYLENLKINVFNSTKIPGLANTVADNLKKYGFNVPSKSSIGNTNGERYKKSKILYVAGSGGTKPETVEALELFIFGGSEIEKLPKYSKDPDVKIEIIVGDDYKLLNF